MGDLSLSIADMLPNFESKRAHCEQHGEFESTWPKGRPEVASGCPICHAARAKQARIAELKGEQRQILHAKLRGILPERLIRFAGFDTWVLTDAAKQKPILSRLASYAKRIQRSADEGVGIIFLGRAGAGKTHLAAAIIKQAVLADRSALYVTAAEMLACIRSTYSSGAKLSESEQLEHYLTPEVMVIDEVDKIRNANNGESAWEVEMLFRIVDGRYQRMHPTIVVSNQNEAYLRDRLGPLIWGRLSERAHRIICDWADYRAAAKPLPLQESEDD